jgi:outer membrane receptor for ferrienterochelin and colicin
LLIDGQQMNELVYSNIPFGNHFPVDQIKRIEIIRGPGSAMYGGNAELGVINVITKTEKDIRGAELSGTFGHMEKAIGRTNLNLNTGVLIKDWEITAKAFLGEANRTDQTFIESIGDLGNQVDMAKGGSEIKSQHHNIGVKNKKFTARLILDDYKTNYTFFEDDSIGNISAYNQFRSILGEMKYDFHATEKLTLTPSFNYKYNRSYYETGYWRNYFVNRYTGSALARYKINDRIFLAAGFESYSDNGQCITDSGYFYSNNSAKLQINNHAVFAEGTVKLNKINLIAGFRTENNSIYGWATAPRIGITGVFNKFHLKTLFSGAFRSPTIGNIELATNIDPEKCFVTEVEIGYRINDFLFATANIYDIQVNNSINYFDNGGDERGVDWGYRNAEKAGSTGFEIELKSLFSKGFASVNYSFYTQALRNIPELYTIPTRKNVVLGFPQHKLTFNTGYQIMNNLQVGTSLCFTEKEYGYSHIDEDEIPQISAFDPNYLWSMAITYDNIIMKGISATLAIHDILNQKPAFVQPYNGGLYPYPGPSREIMFKISISTAVFSKN